MFIGLSNERRGGCRVSVWLCILTLVLLLCWMEMFRRHQNSTAHSRNKKEILVRKMEKKMGPKITHKVKLDYIARFS